MIYWSRWIVLSKLSNSRTKKFGLYNRLIIEYEYGVRPLSFFELQTPDFAWKFVWTVPTNYEKKVVKKIFFLNFLKKFKKKNFKKNLKKNLKFGRRSSY